MEVEVCLQPNRAMLKNFVLAAEAWSLLLLFKPVFNSVKYLTKCNMGQGGNCPVKGDIFRCNGAARSRKIVAERRSMFS